MSAPVWARPGLQALRRGALPSMVLRKTGRQGGRAQAGAVAASCRLGDRQRLHTAGHLTTMLAVSWVPGTGEEAPQAGAAASARLGPRGTAASWLTLLLGGVGHRPPPRATKTSETGRPVTGQRAGSQLLRPRSRGQSEPLVSSALGSGRLGHPLTIDKAELHGRPVPEGPPGRQRKHVLPFRAGAHGGGRWVRSPARPSPGRQAQKPRSRGRVATSLHAQQPRRPFAVGPPLGEAERFSQETGH